MTHGAKGEFEVWEEFEHDPESLAFRSEQLLANRSGRKLEQVANIEERDLPKEGLERDRVVRTRVNQHFFRTTVLAAYDFKCCVSGLAIPELLVASHIVPWAMETKLRMNPRNGLCLHALHDRAFDRGLMYLDEDLRVQFRKRVSVRGDSPGQTWLLSFEGARICLPRRFTPELQFLAMHRDKRGAGDTAV